MYQICYEPLKFPSQQQSFIAQPSDEEYEEKYPSSEYTLIHKCEKFRIYLRKVDGMAFISNKDKRERD